MGRARGRQSPRGRGAARAIFIVTFIVSGQIQRVQHTEVQPPLFYKTSFNKAAH